MRLARSACRKHRNRREIEFILNVLSPSSLSGRSAYCRLVAHDAVSNVNLDNARASMLPRPRLD